LAPPLVESIFFASWEFSCCNGYKFSLSSSTGGASP
jgi:hypothetical protein